MQRARASWCFRAGGILLAIGWTPLLAYVLWETLSGQRGGNPVGLGLLLLFSTPPAVLLLAIGLGRAAIAERSAR